MALAHDAIVALTLGGGSEDGGDVRLSLHVSLLREIPADDFTMAADEASVVEDAANTQRA